MRIKLLCSRGATRLFLMILSLKSTHAGRKTWTTHGEARMSTLLMTSPMPSACMMNSKMSQKMNSMSQETCMMMLAAAALTT